jgi:hypothetical protein
MTTESLRKAVIVRNWNLNHKGMTISYERTDEYTPKTLHLILSPEETARNLDVMACIDGFHLDLDELVIEINGASYAWEDFVINYKTCQWEALNIAINHEGGKELDNDMNLLKLDSAIKALKKF